MDNYSASNFFNPIINYFSEVSEQIEKKVLEFTYDFEENVSKIKKLSMLDQKICLFIGRCADERLPIEKGCFWVSGDLHLAEKSFSSDRIHLRCDFTKPEQLIKLNGLFDKIVIDQSTCKFMEGDFISRFALLLKESSSSQLIFEVTPYMYNPGLETKEFENYFSHAIFSLNYLSKDFDEDKSLYLEYQANVSSEEKQFDLKAFKEEEGVQSNSWKCEPENIEAQFRNYIIKKIRLQTNNPTQMDQLRSRLIDSTQNHVGLIFQQVERIEHSTFPYETNYSQPGKDRFFVATGIKKS